MKIVGEARNPPPASRPDAGFGWGDEEAAAEEEVEEGDDEYERQVKEVRASGEFYVN